MNAPPIAQATCRVCCAMLTLWILGVLIDEVFWQTTLHTVLWSHVLCIALLAAILGALVLMRNRPREWLATAAMLFATTAGLAALSVSDRMLAATQVRWTPFEAQRLGALTIALLAPPRAWVGMICILEVTVVPLVEWATWGPAWRDRLPVAAPWMVVAYGLFAFVVYTHRLARQVLERRMALAQAEAAALDHVARLVLSVRDLANTPLQTIELTVALIRQRETFDPGLVERLQRATSRLIAIAHAVEAEQLAPAEASGSRPKGARRQP